MGKINDFGKVIEGARKDLWKSRGLMVEDTTGMTDLEKEKYVTKDNIWIKPDVNQLLEVFPSGNIFRRECQKGREIHTKKRTLQHMQNFL